MGNFDKFWFGEYYCYFVTILKKRYPRDSLLKMLTLWLLVSLGCWHPFCCWSPSSVFGIPPVAGIPPDGIIPAVSGFPVVAGVPTVSCLPDVADVRDAWMCSSVIYHLCIFSKCTKGTHICTLGYNEFGFFFRKWKIQTLWWVQNWNLRLIYKIHFLIFWAIFCTFGFKVCENG